jgi:hypothetical protein
MESKDDTLEKIMNSFNIAAQERIEEIMEHRRRVKLGDMSCGGPMECGTCLYIARIETKLQREIGESS